MSENEEIMNETENETMAAEVEAVETVETEAARLRLLTRFPPRRRPRLSRPPLITMTKS